MKIICKVVCDKCMKELEAKVFQAQLEGDLRIEVAPCQTCMKEQWDAGYHGKSSPTPCDIL
jgi:hypothetical protein